MIVTPQPIAAIFHALRLPLRFFFEPQHSADV
jgi:hypothetical protein